MSLITECLRQMRMREKNAFMSGTTPGARPSGDLGQMARNYGLRISMRSPNVLFNRNNNPFNGSPNKGTENSGTTPSESNAPQINSGFFNRQAGGLMNFARNMSNQIETMSEGRPAWDRTVYAKRQHNI